MTPPQVDTTSSDSLVDVGSAHQSGRRRLVAAVDALIGALTGTDLEDELTKDLAAQARSVADENLRVVVVGDFKSGKSALINSILGVEVLHSIPFESAPLTTVTTWSPEVGVTLHHHAYPTKDDPRSARTLDHPAFEELIESPPEHGSATTGAVEWIEVGVDAPLSRSGVDFVEVAPLVSHLGGLVAQPGLLDLLALADAVVFVTDTLHPMTAVQLDVLSYVHEALRSRYLLVLNKCDLLASATERDQVARYVTERVSDVFHDVAPPLILTAAPDGEGVDKLTRTLAQTLRVEGRAVGYRHRLLALRASVDALHRGVAMRRTASRALVDDVRTAGVRAVEQVSEHARELEGAVSRWTADFIDGLVGELPAIVADLGVDSTLAASPLRTDSQIENASRKVYADLVSALDARFRSWIRDELTPFVAERIEAAADAALEAARGLDDVDFIGGAPAGGADELLTAAGRVRAANTLLSYAAPLAAAQGVAAKGVAVSAMTLPGLALVGAALPLVGLVGSAASLVMAYRTRRRFADAVREQLIAQTTAALTGEKERIASDMGRTAVRPLMDMARTLSSRARELTFHDRETGGLDTVEAAAAEVLGRLADLTGTGRPDA